MSYRKVNKQPCVGGVFYFLGNFPQHMSHAIHLLREQKGAVVVTSKSAEVEILKKYKNLDIVRVDNKPKFWLHVNKEKDNNITKTINFLNSHAKVVIFYDAFYWEDKSMLINKPTLFLGHGGSSAKINIKDEVRWGHNLNYMTKVNSAGRVVEKFYRKNVDRHRLVRLSNARNDEIVKRIRDSGFKKMDQQLLNVDPLKKTVVYMPTYWGPTSVMDTGLKIIQSIPEIYNVIFWPHPQTPGSKLAEYVEIINESTHIRYPYNNTGIELPNIYNVADVFITDQTTSVVSDMMITGKPIIYAFASPGENFDDTVMKSPIRCSVQNSLIINSNNVSEINTIIKKSLKPIYRQRQNIINGLLLRRFVWLPRGGAVKKTIEVINELIQDE